MRPRVSGAFARSGEASNPLLRRPLSTAKPVQRADFCPNAQIRVSLARSPDSRRGKCSPVEFIIVSWASESKSFARMGRLVKKKPVARNGLKEGLGLVCRETETTTL